MRRWEPRPRWPGLVARALGGTKLAPAAALKGAGTASDMQPRLALPTLCAAAGCALAFAPPVAGLPLGAYASVALLLVGGIGLLPVLVHGLLSLLAPWAGRRPLTMLAVERARRMHGMAAVAVGGVVASLALAVALTVMVASFRGSVLQWLDTALPAPLYLRAAGAGGVVATRPFRRGGTTPWWSCPVWNGPRRCASAACCWIPRDPRWRCWHAPSRAARLRHCRCATHRCPCLRAVSRCM